jgi:predicted DsbA family dithiol-disulfide isomerase
MAAAVPLRIDIVSDVVCPWCIIGLKQVVSMEILVIKHGIIIS